MDKSWMQIKNLLDPVYEDGVEEFLAFAFANKDPDCKLPCPCTECNNFDDQTKEIMGIHLNVYGIVRSYDRWVYHGEDFEDESEDEAKEFEEDIGNDDIPQMLNDIGNANFGGSWKSGEESPKDVPKTKKRDATQFLQLLSEAEKDLYPGYKNYSKLAFIVNILHLKTVNRWTCKSLDMLFKLLKHVFPMASIPTTFYEAKSIIRNLGLKCEKIHACENDCVLYMKEHKDLDQCPNENCKAPRYKSCTSKIPRKVLRYFPLKPRLQRLFVNKEIAEEMRWHKEKRVDVDNTMSTWR